MSVQASAYAGSSFDLQPAAKKYEAQNSGLTAHEQSMNLLNLVSDSPTDSTNANNSGRSKDLSLNRFTRFLNTLPENEKLSGSDVLQRLKGSGLDQELKETFDDTVVLERQGQHVEIERTHSSHLPLNRNILEGKASADKFTIDKSVSFDLANDGNSVSNMHGFSVSVSAFGTTKEVPVSELTSSKNQAGEKTFSARIGNPLPAAAQDILAMTDTITIPLEAENGKFKVPQSSSVFYAVAESAGATLPGLMLEDAMQNLGDISRFAEQNPKWIHDVINPMLKEVKRQAASSNANKTSGQGNEDGEKAPDGVKDQTQTGKTLTAELGSQEITPSTSKTQQISKPGDYERTLTIDGKERNYLLHVPKNYDPTKPIPLLVMLHGRGGDAKQFAERTRMNEKADKEGFAVVYPNATRWLGRKDLSAWDAANGLVPPGARANDVQFLRSVIDQSEAQLEVDPKRIYMIGHSSGGMMAYLAASELSDKLAAVGTVSSAMSGKEPKPKSPVSMISTHGTEDEVIPITGLSDVPPVLSELGIPTFKTPEYATEFWKRQNGITGPGKVVQEGEVTRRDFANPENGTAVSELTLLGSGHTPEDKFNVYDEIWKFMKEHPKASGTVPPSEDPTELVDVRQNPLRGFVENIQIRGANGIASDVARVYREAVNLPDGSIHPASTLESVEKKIGTQINNPAMNFLRNTEELSKKGDQISLSTAKQTEIPLNQSIPGGSLQSLALDEVRFNLASDNGNPRLRDIQGVSLNLQAFGLNRNIDLKTLSDIPDKEGTHTYRLELENPVPFPLRKILFSPDRIGVDMRIDDGGKFQLANENEVKNNILGKNPITRGYFDVGKDISAIFNESAPINALNLSSDAGITAGFASLGLFVPRYKLATSLIGSLAGAPAVIHFVHDKVGS